MFPSPSVWQASNPTQSALLVDLSTALIAHAWFRKYEPGSVESGLIRLAVFATAPVVTTFRTLPSPLVNVPLHLAIFISILLCSIVLYRLSPFHPLAKYPGPIFCKISKFWFAWIAHEGKTHLYFDELHKKYGPIVRIGKQFRLMPHKRDIHALVQVPTNCPQGMPKGPMWEGRYFAPGKKQRSGYSLISARDFTSHAKLRKPWNRAFGSTALKDYEEALIARGTQLVEILKGTIRDSQDGVGHADISKCISNWSFDFMGDAIFGENFDLMATNDKDGLVQALDDAHWFPTISQMVPWAWEFFTLFPAFTRSSGKFSKFAFQQAQKRGTKVTEKRDLFYHLAANMDIDDDKPPLPLIISNAILAMVAGSHTTSLVISSIMYHLLLHPEYLVRLQKELDTAFPPSEQSVIQLDKLANLELLEAIINEDLRLQPPVPTYLQRAPSPGSGGRLLKDIFIPEGTAVVVPPYAMHRDPRNFSPDPERFWPERWYTQSDRIILDRAAFIPFSHGPANCVGRPLAMQEMRYITSMLVYNFDFSLEDGYNLKQWGEDLADRFILIKGNLPVKVKRRNVARV
ncbi:hypothetical protein Clacol_001118 [Clathrus columnatus]|uniref:Cytochrome P450 n=1 Tax=Clathrus columnatus TaxID=1419009 RepID=A0AAV5A061_9AGAM|nr:hypothetical protein Clacol_001118 [Clathrus columnatus]